MLLSLYTLRLQHMPPRPNLPPNQPNQNQTNNKSKLIPQEVEDGEITKPPVTTVFVGSISERAPDNMIRTLLQVIYVTIYSTQLLADR